MRVLFNLILLLFFQTVNLFALDIIPPEYLVFSVADRKVTCDTTESGHGLDVRTSIDKDTLVFQFPVFLGKTTNSKLIDIPLNVRKVRLFDCEFDLPEGKDKAIFRAQCMYDIQPPWYSFAKAETMYCFLWTVFGKDLSGDNVFYGKRVVVDRSEGKLLYRNESPFRCRVTSDGQVFEWLGDRANWNPAMSYCLSRDFMVFEGKLQTEAQGPLKYYKGLIRAWIPLAAPFEPPEYKPILQTVLRLNAPYMIDYLRKFYGGNPQIMKSETELLTFVKNANTLRIGMPPDKVKSILGTPDTTQTAGPKQNSGSRENELVYRYYFLRLEKSNVNMKDMSVDVRFRLYSDGSASLKTIGY